MSLGPEKIILILVVALIVFGPQRLPEIARQVGAALRELRRMQDTVRGELEQVLHPDFAPPNAGVGDTAAVIEDTDHAALPAPSHPASPGTYPEPPPYPTDMTYPTDAAGNGHHAAGPDHSDENVTDDGFAGPRSFS